MIAVVDIDGVLADAAHRQHHVDRVPKDWDAFFAEVGQDAPIAAGLALVQELAAGHDVVLLSGRPERTRADTEDWLSRHGVTYTRLLLRSDPDRRRADLLKADLIATVGPPEAVSIVVDDDPRVVEALTRVGYATLLFR